MLKFDYIIQNPPFRRTLHCKFFNFGLDILKEDGKMTIIEPATWLINLREGVGNNLRVYEPMKKRVKGHVRKIVLENYNKAFGISLYTPCSITYIDKGTTFDEIEFVNCGSEEKVSDIYDCNLIGDYKLIQSIISKCKQYGDMMKDHIYQEGKTKTDENTYYCKYADIIGCGGVEGQDGIRGGGYKYDSTYNTFKDNGQFRLSFFDSCYHHTNNSISKTFVATKPEYNLYGTKTELDNWKHFVFNNKLPLFLNICLIIAQNNTSKGYVPWLTDKQYTDDEIYKLLNINKKEQKLIDSVIQKFERNSKWFKRYMTGQIC